MNNLSIRNMTLIVSLLLWLSQLLLLGLLSLFTTVEIGTTPILIYFVVSLIMISGIVFFFLEKIILKHINLVYRIVGNKQNPLKKNSLRIDPLLSGVNHDITTWIDNKAEEPQYLKSLEIYRRKFLGDISHELKTPLFSIQGYLHTLIEGGIYDESININYLRRAIQNTDRLQMIVADLELINKLDSEENEIKIAVFDLMILVEEVFSDLAFMAEERNIVLDYGQDTADSYSVSGDREKIRQVFNNLISNSIKYGKDNGLTTLSFHEIDQVLLIEVTDNGIGIEEKHLKHLFDRFYRVEKSRSRSVGGSGLGLSIVKHIVEAHGNTLTVSSRIEEGTTFGFTLNKATYSLL